MFPGHARACGLLGCRGALSGIEMLAGMIPEPQGEYLESTETAFASPVNAEGGMDGFTSVLEKFEAGY